MSKKSEKINNGILADARKDIRNARIAIAIGIIFILTIITLVCFSVLNIGLLVFVPILGYLTYIQIDALWMKLAVFELQQYIFDEEFKKEYDKKHNLNQNKDEK